MISLHIPELMPDEFMMGYLGRIGAANGFNNEAETRSAIAEWYRQATGSSTVATLIEQVAYASQIVTQHIARHHTLIPVFRAVATHLNQHPHGDSGDFGLLSANGPRLLRDDLQICPDCIKEDIDYLGFTYWRRSHQLPGIDWCLKHATPMCNVDKKSHFEQPIMVLENQSGIAMTIDEGTETNPIVRKYAELLQVVLDFSSPIAPQAITPLLAKKAGQKGLRTAPLGKKPLFSDMALDLLPRTWVKKHFPTLLQKKANDFSYEYDGVCKSGGKAHSSISYILATAILCETVQDGQELLWDAVHSAPAESQTKSAAKPISQRKLKSAYISSNGHIKHMANMMQCKYRSLLVSTKVNGLPALTNVNIETLQALQDFYDKKATLLDILMRPGVQPSHLSEILRTVATPHAKLLSGIMCNRSL